MKYINFLIKPASSACNLRCRYCFYEDIAKNRQVKNLGIMQEDTMETLLSQAFELSEPGGEVHFAFQGGEPTLAGLSYFRRFTERAKLLCPKKVQIHYAIQTNGIVLDEEWAVFLQKYDFLVGLSLDGYKELHNQNRVDAQGKDTWNAVCRALRLLKKHRVRTNILCVVTGQCAGHPQKIYQELKRLEISHMQFIPCLDPMDGPRGRESFSLNPEKYGDFLCVLFDLWYRDWESGQYRSIRLFEDYVNILLGESQITCSTCGYCGGYFVVEGDGSVYPCDFYVLDEYRLGSLEEASLEEINEKRKEIHFVEDSAVMHADCEDCKYAPICRGGCRRHRVPINHQSSKNFFCESYYEFFDYTIRRLEEIAVFYQKSF